MTKFQQSPQWEKINVDLVERYRESSLDNFRRDGLSQRYSTWPVAANAMRFFKTLMFNELCALSAEELKLLAAIPDRQKLGNPITVAARGVRTCMDYILAAKELAFLKDVLSDAKCVLEIGAGYGRTCHSVLSTHASIETYVIIDLAPSLTISRRYLETVLPPALFAKVKFLAVGEFDGSQPIECDLVINVNSMAEMDAPVVDNYLAFINGNARAFYCANPVGKFTMASLEGQEADAESVRRALMSGKLREIVDIFDEGDIARHIPAFLEAYRPGADWQVVRESRNVPWSYYHQALYRKTV